MSKREKWLERGIRARGYFFECMKAQGIDMERMSRELSEIMSQIQEMPTRGRRQLATRDQAFEELSAMKIEFCRKAGAATFRAFHFTRENKRYLTRGQRKKLFG
jgi:hypothetical protein